ncbi:MAG: hypothetical protein H0T46_29375 [Deltaproteobacteria bacterium]|nr:hypothetical protein [Deltaproteobacteria bacterium]
MRTLVLASVLLAGCVQDPPPLTDDTSLSCPRNGLLPFRLPTIFKNADTKMLVREKTRSKDESSDTIGNPSGPYASIYLAPGQTPSSAPIAYRGTKARTLTTDGLVATPILDEQVSLWTYDDGMWLPLGTTRTDELGAYEISETPYVAPNGHPIYSMLDGDHSCAEHYSFLYPRGSKVVLTDIDGTLTTDDGQLLAQIPDERYVPKMMGAADKLAQAWAMKGYPIIYLTSRPHLLRPETRGWLRDLGFPLGAVITTKNVGDAAPFKAEWIQRMKTGFGWDIVAAYGNADTDVVAYETAGIPKNVSFIVGPLAGMDGTVAIDNMDFSAHIASFVASQPENR